MPLSPYALHGTGAGRRERLRGRDTSLRPGAGRTQATAGAAGAARLAGLSTPPCEEVPAPVFGRRSSNETATPVRRGGATAASLVEEAERAAGKGRPTPKRRDAEAARKQRLTPPRSRKEAAAVARRRRAETMAAQQEAMRTGDERHLPARDQGGVRRFCRDLVDARWNAAEFLLPLLLVILVLSLVPLPQVQVLATLIWLVAIVAPVVDSVLLVRKVRAALATTFPGESTRGALPYALLRSAQLRRWRMPRPQVARGATVQARRR